MADYETVMGINYYNDGTFAFCDRCGKSPIINHKCLYCDVRLTDHDIELARELTRYCFHPRQGAIPGSFNGRPEKFDMDMAARIIAVRKNAS